MGMGTKNGRAWTLVAKMAVPRLPSLPVWAAGPESSDILWQARQLDAVSPLPLIS
eukprot:gene23598-187_t